MANFILTDSVLASFRSVFFCNVRTVSPDELDRYLAFAGSAAARPTFFTESQLAEYPYFPKYSGVTIEQPLSFRELCRLLASRQWGPVVFGLQPPDDRLGRGSLRILERPADFPVERAMALLKMEDREFGCREDLIAGAMQGTGLSEPESLRLLATMFHLRFSFEWTDFGIRCDDKALALFPLLSQSALFRPESMISVPLSTVLAESGGLPHEKFWEIFLRIPDRWLNCVHLRIWDHDCRRQRFSGFDQETRRKILLLIRRKREFFLNRLKSRLGINDEEARMILELFFYGSEKLYETEESIMIRALAVGYWLWEMRSPDSFEAHSMCIGRHVPL